MLDNQQWQRLSIPQREQYRVEQTALFDARIQAARQKFYDQAVAARAEADKAYEELKKSPPGDYLLSGKMAAADKARAKADVWTQRANSAADGKFRLTQDEHSEPGFVIEHGELIRQATALERIDS